MTGHAVAAVWLPLMVIVVPVPGQVTCVDTVDAEHPPAVENWPLPQFAAVEAPVLVGAMHWPVVVLYCEQPVVVVAAAVWMHAPVVWL
jgi:hypothetical protein